jgi:hypothetical protein
VSCETISKPAFDKIIPVNPPIVKSIKKPKEKRNGVFTRKLPPQIVANRLKTFMPVGTAMIIVTAIR